MSARDGRGATPRRARGAVRAAPRVGDTDAWRGEREGALVHEEDEAHHLGREARDRDHEVGDPPEAQRARAVLAVTLLGQHERRAHHPHDRLAGGAGGVQPLGGGSGGADLARDGRVVGQQVLVDERRVSRDDGDRLRAQQNAACHMWQPAEEGGCPDRDGLQTLRPTELRRAPMDDHEQQHEEHERQRRRVQRRQPVATPADEQRRQHALCDFSQRQRSTSPAAA